MSSDEAKNGLDQRHGVNTWHALQKFPSQEHACHGGPETVQEDWEIKVNEEGRERDIWEKTANSQMASRRDRETATVIQEEN